MTKPAIIWAASAMGGRREVGPRSNRGAQKRRADHGGVFGGAEAISVVETTTRSLRNVPKGKELVNYLPKKEARIGKSGVSAILKLR